MSRRDILKTEPWRFNFFGLMREYERSYPQKPRIGTNLVLDEEIIQVGQDPFLEFPTSNVSDYSEVDGRPDRLRVRFLGFFGPQGALPLNTTAEIIDWKNRRNPAFIRFTDIFGARFYQLFFRAWASARRIVQFDRPLEDRFQTYLKAVAGVPEAAHNDPPDTVPVQTRLDLAGLLGNRIRGPRRLKQVLQTALGVEIDIEEYLPVWIDYEPSDRSRLGEAGSTLGVDLRLGNRALSVSDKIRVNVKTSSLQEYCDFLPGQGHYQLLLDLTRGFVGPIVDIEVAPSMPRDALPPVRLGEQGAVGHTSWIAPKKPEKDTPVGYVQSAVFLSTAGHLEDDREPA